MANGRRRQAGLALERSVDLVDLASVEPLHYPVTKARPDSRLDEAAVLVRRSRFLQGGRRRALRSVLPGNPFHGGSSGPLEVAGV